MSSRTRRIAAAALLALAAAAPAAEAALPDKWARWAAAPRDTTIRSLDFQGALYAGSESDGVYASAFAVGPWAHHVTGLEAPGADDVRQVKAGPNGLLYAATSAGLFSAQPGGAWSPVGQGAGPDKLNMGGIQSIVFNDPSGLDMTVAVAGAAGPGVYNTANGGDTWKRASGMPAGENVFHLTAAPAGTPMYAAADDGVFVSLDFGRTWTLASDGIPPGETTLRVGVSPVDPTRLYASTSSGAYRFEPQKLRWVAIGGADDQRLPAGAKRAFVLAPPLNGQFGDRRAVVGTESGVYATIDDGDHWKEMSPETFAPDAGTAMGDRIVWSLGLGFSSPTLMAGTAGFGVFSLALQPVELTGVTITEPPSKVPGASMTATLDGLAGTRPYFLDYQWYRCAANTAGCSPNQPINGATSATYRIPDEDEAKANMRYRVIVTARNLVHPTQIVRSDDSTAGVGATPGAAPEPKSGQLPSLSPGINQVPTPAWGQQYTISPGGWQRSDATPVNLGFTTHYKWQRCNGNGTGCEDIGGQTGTTYTTTPADIGKKVVAFVRGVNLGTSSDWYLAGMSNTVVNRHPAITVAPKVVGEPYAGQTLSSSAGGWNGHDMTYERRWLRCEADGLGCNPVNPPNTGSTYALTPADVGKRLRIEVTAVGEDPNQDRRTTAVSEASPVIANPPVAGGGGPGGGQVPGGGGAPGGGAPGKPALRLVKPRKVKVGAKLAAPKAVGGFAVKRYQWLRNGKRIKRATKRTYRIARKDRGRTLACRVTLVPAGGGAAVVVRTPAVKVPRKR